MQECLLDCRVLELLIKIKKKILAHFSVKFRAVSPRPLPVPSDVTPKTAQRGAEHPEPADSAKPSQAAIPKVSVEYCLLVFVSFRLSSSFQECVHSE